MNELIKSGEKQMTVTEVAGILGVEPQSIRWNIRKLFPGVMINGKTTYLIEEQVVAIKKNMTPSSTLTGAVTPLEMEELTLRVLEYHASELKRLREENTTMLPKAEFYDAVTGSPDTIEIGMTAKVLNMGIGRNKLFDLLRRYKILRENNEPYQRYVDAGCFRVIETKYTVPNGDTRINFKTVVYQKGVDFIRKVVQKSIDDGTIDKIKGMED
jgi:phage antirepressor YoqD-like protein